MKKLTSVKYPASAFNFATLILRFACGGLLLPHGYDKLVNYATYKKDFMNFLGLGGAVSLALLIFAEFFCAGLLVLGLFTRLAAIPIIIAMGVALFKAHKGLIFSEGEHAALVMLIATAILLIGPGRISVDGMVNK